MLLLKSQTLQKYSIFFVARGVWQTLRREVIWASKWAVMEPSKGTSSKGTSSKGTAKGAFKGAFKESMEQSVRGSIKEIAGPSMTGGKSQIMPSPIITNHYQKDHKINQEFHCRFNVIFFRNCQSIDSWGSEALRRLFRSAKKIFGKLFHQQHPQVSPCNR